MPHHQLPRALPELPAPVLIVPGVRRPPSLDPQQQQVLKVIPMLKHFLALLALLSLPGCAALLGLEEPSNREQVVASTEAAGGLLGGIVGGPAGSAVGSQLGAWAGEAAIAAFLVYHKLTEKKRHARHSAARDAKV